MMALDYDLLESLKHTAQFDTANFGILLRAAFREHNQPCVTVVSALPSPLDSTHIRRDGQASRQAQKAP